MKRFGRKTLSVLAGVAASSVTATPADAQFVAVNNYQAPVQTAPSYPAPAQQAPVYQAPASYQAPAYQAQAGYAAYPRVAQAGELPTPTEAVGSGTKPMAAPVAPAAITPTPVHVSPTPVHASPAPVMHQAIPQASYTQAAPVTHGGACATGNCGGAPVVQSAPMVDYTYGGYSQPIGSYDNFGAPACDLGRPARPRRQWFGGIYALLLERDNPGKESVAVFVEDATTIPLPYYAPNTAGFLFSSDADTDVAWGGEIRFGSTFGADPCNCNQQYAWEVAYWGLDEDANQATLIQSTPIGPTAGNLSRIYGRINYAGLEYDRTGTGTGYRPLNDYADYQVPVTNAAPDDVRVTGQRVRQTFQAQNIEINFWRFGTPATAGGGALLSKHAGAFSGGPCGGGACGVDPCGSGGCQVGCGRPPRRFFMNGLAGLRIFRMDETFQNAFQFTTVDALGDPNAGEPTQYTGGFPTDDDNNLFHDIEVDNQLLGFQLGCSMNWLVGCKWNLFADSNFGVYNNNIDVYQRVFGGGPGNIRFIGDGTNVAVRSSVDRAAFLGDLRLGFGYQVSCNCRLTAAYRVIAASGVALAVEQIPTAFDNAELLSHIDDNDSLILHGLQTGVEFKY